MLSLSAILPAAGRGQRMGADRNKLLLPLHTASILEHSLAKLREHPSIRHIYLVFAPEDQASIAPFASLPDVTLVAGGPRRQDSVANALRQVNADEKDEAVLVHDAARPLCSPTLIARVASALEQHPAVIPVIALKDTIRKVQGEHVSLVDRSELVATQTPQGFRLEPYLHATRQAQLENWSVTDDASLLEKAGVPLHVVDGEETNLKITTPLDLQFARFLLSQTLNLPT
jgi:2-C-methyl-D-erythritol 4-phosphate cytidylyltransferase